MEPTTIPDGWVMDDDALFTAVKLKALMPGDEIIVGARPGGLPCLVSAGMYTFASYYSEPNHYFVTEQVRNPVYREHFLAWRPRRG